MPHCVIKTWWSGVPNAMERFRRRDTWYFLWSKKG